MTDVAPTEPAAAAAAGPPPGEARFAFGRNWARFLRWLDDDRIAAAQARMRELLGLADGETLEGRTFLDIGSGSGLMSLCAMRLGAAAVRSFDYDADSVACTAELQRRYFADDPRWTVSRGDATDDTFMQSLGSFDIVYSFGVLHHTGKMWHAIDLATQRVGPGGRFALAIYNQQGWRSRVWWLVKRIYVALPRPLRLFWVLAFLPRFELPLILKDALKLRPPWHHWRTYRQQRGMSLWHDYVDWVGGFPFEVARPEEIFDFCQHRGFRLDRLLTCGGGLGNNQFRFTREQPAAERT